ncbi:hypothetical protein ACFIJ5_07700 [Haloimpatiens sp. FM7330]|uniref:hypothetical protein n=1 Tax=Haloimpatiens sp. FM7330 TaxID=3298610 RepID=UPI0036370870
MIKLKNLNKDEKMLMIEFLPIKEVIKFLKKNSKLFKNKFDGAYFNPKSKLLQKKIPKVFTNAIEEGDKITIDFIKIILYEKLEEINQYVKSNLNISKNIEEIVQKKQMKEYIKLMIILLEKIEPKYIMLFFTLNGIQLKVRQKKLVQNSIEKAIEYKEIREQVQEEERKKLERTYRDKINQVEKKEQILLKNEKNINKSLKDKLLEKDRIIKEKRQKLNLKIKEIEIQQREYSSLKNKLDISESEIKRIKEKLKDNKESCKQDLERERQENEELQTINEKQKLKIKQLNNELKERYEIYSKKYIEKWEEENQSIIDKKISLTEEIRSLNDTIKVSQRQVMNLEEEKDKVQKKLREYNSLVTNFISNIDKELIKSALKSSILNSKELIQKKENHIELYIKNQIKCDKINTCESIEEWTKVVAYNLKNIGIRKNRTEWSDYIVSVLAAKIIPLIVGCKTREIAKAISYTYAGETPLIVTLPSGYSEVNELIDLYHNSKAKVILIEGVVGQINESLMLPLFKEYIETEENDRIIVASCEDINMVNLMPSYLLEYMALIKITDIRPVVQHNYVCTDSTSLLQLMRKNELEINDSYKKLSKLLKHIEVVNAYIITRSLILAYLCNEKEMQNALVCLSICDLKLMFKDNDVREKIANNIDNYQNDFTQELKNLIVGE